MTKFVEKSLAATGYECAECAAPALFAYEVAGPWGPFRSWACADCAAAEEKALAS